MVKSLKSFEKKNHCAVKYFKSFEMKITVCFLTVVRVVRVLSVRHL
jgi:hypothetical protein